jgi:beta-RFAP synthase
LTTSPLDVGMTQKRLHIAAPSRLHFGLLSFGHADRRQFGGAGAMVELPGLELIASSASRFHTSGLHAERAERAARKWSKFYALELPLLELSIIRAPRLHIGLGVGTQLALAVATALQQWASLPHPAPAELAASVGRAARSAIGAYGFRQGGFIVERGKLQHEAFSPLDCRLDLPDEWRFVLATPQEHEGLFGVAEAETFARLPPVPEKISGELANELRLELVPAAAAGDFERFANSLFRYGHQAGLCYAAVQGGAYHGRIVTDLVRRLRALGVKGVGQSSWGPTVFALLPNATEAEHVRGELAASQMPLDVIVTPPANRGATMEWVDPGQ